MAVGAPEPVGATHASPELTPAQQAMDARDWSFGGTWPYEPRWLFTDGIRIHYVDEGPREGEPVVMLQGNPTWAYAYRHLISAVSAAGFRAVAHDEIGFGRSDKPEREREYSIQRHAKHFAALMDELDLDGVTLVMQDWGGPIALSWAGANPGRVRRLIILNTWPGGVIPDFPKPSPPFRLMLWPLTGELLVKGLHAFVRVGMFKGGICHMDRLGENERSAYLSPNPSWASRTGILAYPRLIAFDERHPTYELGRRNEDGLAALADKPVLVCWPGRDLGFKDKTLRYWRDRFPQAEVHKFDDAGHYLEEDAHERTAPLILDFLRRT